MFRFALSLLALTLFSFSTFATSPEPSREQFLTLTAHWENLRSEPPLLVHNEVVFTAVQNKIMRLPLEGLVPNASLFLFDSINSLEAQDNILYALSANTLYLIDTRTLTLISKLDFPTPVSDLVGYEQSVYVTGQDQLYVVDIKNEYKPVVAGTVPATTGFDIYGVENGRFVINTGPELEIWSAANAQRPQKQSTYTLPELDVAVGAILQDTHLYLLTSRNRGCSISTCAYDNFWHVLDLTEPTMPTVETIMNVAEGNFSGTVAVTLAQELLYIANTNGELLIFTASDLTMPNYLTLQRVSTNAPTLATDGTNLIVADDSWQRYSLANPQEPLLVGTYSNPVGQARSVTLGDGYGLFTFLGQQIRAIDISNPQQPVTLSDLVGIYEGGFIAAQLEGDRAYILYEDTATSPAVEAFLILDMADPTAPQLLGKYRFERPLSHNAQLFLHNTKAFVVWNPGVGEQGISILDLSNPMQPNELAFMPLSPMSHAAQLGNYLFQTEFNPTDPPTWHLSALDLSDPNNISTIPIDFLLPKEELYISKEVGYVLSNPLQVLDFSDPLNPQLVTEIPFSRKPSSLAFYDGFLYVSIYNSTEKRTQLHLFDTRTGMIPRQTAVYQIPAASTHQLAVHNDVVAIASSDHGIYWLQKHNTVSNIFLPIIADHTNE